MATTFLYKTIEFVLSRTQFRPILLGVLYNVFMMIINSTKMEKIEIKRMHFQFKVNHLKAIYNSMYRISHRFLNITYLQESVFHRLNPWYM